MNWPIGKSGVKLLRVIPDEEEGQLCIWAVFDDGTEQHIVYEGMFYSQLDEQSAGLIITSVTEITPEELNKPGREQSAAKLYEDCGADDVFLNDMCRRGNRLFVHHTDNGEYIVLAKRLKAKTKTTE